MSRIWPKKNVTTCVSSQFRHPKSVFFAWRYIYYERNVSKVPRWHSAPCIVHTADSTLLEFKEVWHTVLDKYSNIWPKFFFGSSPFIRFYNILKVDKKPVFWLYVGGNNFRSICEERTCWLMFEKIGPESRQISFGDIEEESKCQR